MVTGDEDAVRELRRRHAPTLYAMVYARIWDPVAADWVVEEVFRQAQRHAPQFDARRGSAFGWLVHMAQALASSVSLR
jgi:RNA polymerase sigma-70 factor (ECF subfamily)